MKWQDYSYHFGLELLHPYIANEEVAIFKSGEPETLSTKKSFKGWEGILSSIHTRIGKDKYALFILISESIGYLVVTFFNDINSTVMVEELDDFINHRTSRIDSTSDGV